MERYVDEERKEEGGEMEMTVMDSSGGERDH